MQRENVRGVAISPRKPLPVHASGGVFPLRFRWKKTLIEPGCSWLRFDPVRPERISIRAEPRNQDHGLVLRAANRFPSARSPDAYLNVRPSPVVSFLCQP